MADIVPFRLLQKFECKPKRNLFMTECFAKFEVPSSSKSMIEYDLRIAPRGFMLLKSGVFGTPLAKIVWRTHMLGFDATPTAAEGNESIRPSG